MIVSDLDAFFSISSLIAVLELNNTTLNGSCWSRHPCLIHDLRRKVFSFSPLNTMLELVIFGLDCVEVNFFYTQFVESFYHEGMLNFMKCFFSTSLEMTI